MGTHLVKKPQPLDDSAVQIEEFGFGQLIDDLVRIPALGGYELQWMQKVGITRPRWCPPPGRSDGGPAVGFGSRPFLPSSTRKLRIQICRQSSDLSNIAELVPIVEQSLLPVIASLARTGKRAAQSAVHPQGADKLAGWAEPRVIQHRRERITGDALVHSSLVLNYLQEESNGTKS
jgi:hypothetical protein